MKLTPRERTRRALARRIPDVVPKGELWIDPRIVGALAGSDQGLPPGRKEIMGALRALNMDFFCFAAAPAGGEPFAEPDGRLWPEISCWRRESDFFLFGLVGGGFSHLAYKLGLDTFLGEVCRDRNRFYDLAARSTRHNTGLALDCIRAGVDGIIITEDLAYNRGPFLPPDLLRDVLYPLLAEEIRQIKQTGVPVVLHSDGNLNSLLPDLALLGFDGLHSLDPGAGMNLSQLKGAFGRRWCLMGNIPLEDLEGLPSPGAVDQAVQQAVAQGAPGGGYILSTSSGALRAELPLEHILAMYRAGDVYGRYR